ncbi:MAG: PAS domain-containing protein, partial [Holosporales bacterium]|nr:PAS domain-containing protein [Holosporales bacterium]
DLSWKHIADVLKKTDQRIMNTKISEEVIETPKLASGKEVVMLSRKSPLYDDEDNVIGIIGVSIDITAHKRAEELEAQRESQQKEIDLQNKIKNIFEKFVKNISFTLTELAVVIQNNKNLTEEEQIDITSKAIGIKSIINELQIALQENRLDRFTG